MTCVELLAPRRGTLDLILASGGCGIPAAAAGAESVTSLAGLVSELISWLERDLEETAALCHPAGLQHLFLANNTSYVLKRAVDADEKSLLGDDRAAQRRGRLDLHIDSELPRGLLGSSSGLLGGWRREAG